MYLDDVCIVCMMLEEEVRIVIIHLTYVVFHNLYQIDELYEGRKIAQPAAMKKEIGMSEGGRPGGRRNWPFIYLRQTTSKGSAGRGGKTKQPRV